ncbi:hypothetical protein M6B38_222775 [Iris pallida]|uniref:Uncharacterized protein n=1 Tax=Iris pallida TaxID=29817 RepID=A0AAX6DX38_IRIPA|nr:hypothetical protein M6B38_222775 [Iris pallida]
MPFIINLTKLYNYQVITYIHAVLVSCFQGETSTPTRLLLCLSVLHSCAMFSYRTRDTHDCLVPCSLLVSHCLLRRLGEILAFV